MLQVNSYGRGRTQHCASPNQIVVCHLSNVLERGHRALSRSAGFSNLREVLCHSIAATTDAVSAHVWDGVRNSECDKCGLACAMAWRDVDFERGVWRIGKTKNGTPQNVPLTTEAKAILRARKEAMRTPSAFVFPYTLCGSTGMSGLYGVDPKPEKT